MADVGSVNGRGDDGRAVVLIGTLDTKAKEAAYLEARLSMHGISTILVDTGILGPPVRAGIGREQVAEAGGTTIAELVRRGDRGVAMDAMSRGVARLVPSLISSGAAHGVLALAGSSGARIALAAMRELPVTVPKLLVTTGLTTELGRLVGASGVIVAHSVVDIAGLNSVTRPVFDNVAAAIAGAVRRPATTATTDRPVVAGTMFGVTTRGMSYAREVLERAGCEVLVFHATGAGGDAMEALIRHGSIDGVLDYTTTELADMVVGGARAASPGRLAGAGEADVPAVVGLGALDIVNFGSPESVPERFAGRTFHRHVEGVTLMRTSASECAEIGRRIAAEVGRARSPQFVVAPLRGLSALDAPGQPFCDPEADRALFDALRTSLPKERYLELDLHVNDPAFAEAMAERLLAIMRL